MDAFLQIWEGILAYAFPQASLELGKTVSLSRVLSDLFLLVSDGAVSGSAGGTNGTTSSVAYLDTSLPLLPSGAVFTSSSCLETVWWFSRHEGYSRKVSKELTLARRLLLGKYIRISGFCTGNGVRIIVFLFTSHLYLKLSIFFYFFLRKRIFSILAIKGYKSMLRFHVKAA